MTDGTTTPQLEAPPTVAEFVRSRYRDTVTKYLLWATISIPGLAALRLRQQPQGFSWNDLWVLPAGWLMICAMACVAAAISLSVAGWWKLRTRMMR